jgi:hypothetical protein
VLALALLAFFATVIVLGVLTTSAGAAGGCGGG